MSDWVIGFRFILLGIVVACATAFVVGDDQFQHTLLSPEDAVESMVLPEGFSATLFAGEPDIKQPIAMAIDDRGRIWVAEAYTYPIRAPEGEGRDRILIFEDADGDGKFDKRTVFAENLNLVSGLEVGFGGVWVGAAPYLLFIPDRNGDDVPDSKPEVLLDGWGYQDTHETLNAFIWGPDGWLYGCHGVFTHSKVGKPGTPEDQREPINAGVWRYHPTRHEFEVFAYGTSNPWGVDFDDHGQAICTACVIPHLFHMIQGGRYHRQSGVHFNPYTYDDIKTIADHVHYLGATPHSGNNKSDSAGGGHAHAGAMIYLGGAWPEKYRQQIIMNNIHGQRLNTDLLVPHGSGLVGRHGPDFLLTEDRASQMLNFRYGPDGQVYIIDWYDMQACHTGRIEDHDRSNGRIYKIAFGTPTPVSEDLRQRSDRQLAELVLNKNDWYVRHSRRVLQERCANRALDTPALQRLVAIATTHADATRRLRAAWTLHVTGEFDELLGDKLLNDANDFVRAWAIQISMETSSKNSPPNEELLQQMLRMARNDSSPVVRLYLASALQRIDVDKRWEILAALASHPEDAKDHNLPLMIWYAAEPLVEVDMSRALALASAAKIPLVRSFLLRRIAEIGSPEAVDLLITALGEATNAPERVPFLKSINTALKGRRNFPMPKRWPEIYRQIASPSNATPANPVVHAQARQLGVVFGEPTALSEMRSIAANVNAKPAHRSAALASLVGANDASLVPLLQSLVGDKLMRRDALRALAAYSDPKTPTIILQNYSSFNIDDKRDAIATLASRIEYALEMLDGIEAGTISSSDLSADIVRQLGNLNNEQVTKRIAEVWGVVRETPADRKEQIEFYKKLITGPGKPADISFGRSVFAKTCQQCHKLFAAGESIGPELTGSNRANLDYLLSNVIDPSALMAKAYQSSILVTDSGRVLTGIAKKSNEQSVTIVTSTETVIVPRNEIDELVLSDVSMMPEDQWKNMNPHEIRSLVAYLAAPHQVPVLATAENAETLFNGRNLKGWTGDMSYWSVENGEIVGASPGIKENQFLVSDLAVSDFELTLKVKLTPNAGNSGIQFRSEHLENGHVRGYQADVGVGWWGALYEELGRAVLSKPADPNIIKNEQWNDYRIVVNGDHVQTFINGHPCVDLHDKDGSRRGIIALQIHAGAPMEVRFKEIRLRVADTVEE